MQYSSKRWFYFLNNIHSQIHLQSDLLEHQSSLKKSVLGELLPSSLLIRRRVSSILPCCHQPSIDRRITDITTAAHGQVDRLTAKLVLANQPCANHAWCGASRRHARNLKVVEVHNARLTRYTRRSVRREHTRERRDACLLICQGVELRLNALHLWRSSRPQRLAAHPVGRQATHTLATLRNERPTISTRAARDLVICQLSRGVGTPLLELHCLISLASPSTRVSGWTTRLGCRGVQGRVSRKVRHLALRGCAVAHSR